MLNIRMAQLNYTIGDFEGNRDSILNVIRNSPKADVIVFSELAVTGYYPWDLVESPEFLAAQDRALNEIREATRGIRAAVVLGCVTRTAGPGKRLQNSLVVFRDGEQVFRYAKHLLPTYNIFDEARHFEPGTRTAPWMMGDTKIGLLICEDAWNDGDDPLYKDNPVEDLVKNGARILISLNASPSNLGKIEQRNRVFGDIARKHCVPIVYVNQVGAHDEIVFDGASFAMSNEGKVVSQLWAFFEGTCDVVFDGRDVYPLSNHPPLPKPVDPAAFAFEQLGLGLRDYLRKCGFNKVVVGSSGGIDSAVTIALAALNLGPENVTAITMPTRHSSSGSVKDSERLCRNLGVQLIHAPIDAQYQLEMRQFREDFGQEMDKIARENVQARLRGLHLMAFSNQTGALLLTTGNKSETSVGYSTLYGDMNGGLNLIGDLYKMEVYALARYINAWHGGEVIPDAIIEKAPSAELSSGQLDTDALPAYPVLDAILANYIEGDLLTPEEVAANEATVAEAGFDAEAVAKIRRMVDRAEFKRRQAAPIIRMHKRAFGGGRRLPIARA